MSYTGATTCDDCVHFWRNWSITGDTNKIGKCDFDDQAGVAQVGTVLDTSDCPWWEQIKVNIHKEDAYPGSRLRYTGDDKDTINTRADLQTVDPFRETKRKYPERFEKR